MGVSGDSTSADVNVVLRQGLDSNGTRTMSDGMLWSVSNKASGAYKIQAITGERQSQMIITAQKTAPTGGKYA